VPYMTGVAPLLATVSLAAVRNICVRTVLPSFRRVRVFRVTAVAFACRRDSAITEKQTARTPQESPIDASLLQRAVRAQATLRVWFEALERAAPPIVGSAVPDDVQIEQVRARCARLALFWFLSSCTVQCDETTFREDHSLVLTM
jgi:hypothetical protein